MLKRSACLLLLLLQGACLSAVLDDRCGPAFRQTIVMGTISDGQGEVGSATMELVEERGGPRRLHTIVMGPRSDAQGGPLKGHVTRARLVHAGTGATLRELSAAPGLGPEMLQTTLDTVDLEAFVGLRDVFEDGDVALELVTDLPGRGRFLVPLPLASATGWERAHCS